MAMKKNNDINILDSRVFADATHKNDRKRNADAYSSHLTRFRIKSGMTGGISLSSLGKSCRDATRGSIMAQSGRSMTEMLGVRR